GAGGQVQCRALARARRPEQRDELARLDARVEAAQRDRLRRARSEDLEDVVVFERSEHDRIVPLRLAIEAPQRHVKLSIINRYASTLSTPRGVPRSTTARLPPLQRWYRSTTRTTPLPLPALGAPCIVYATFSSRCRE